MADIAKITLKGESEAKNFIDEALRGDIAYEELSTTVSKTGGYVAGDHLIYLGQYYEVVADIAQGGTIVTSGAGQNVEEREVGDEIKKNKTQVVAQIQTLTSAFANNINENGSKNAFTQIDALVNAHGITYSRDSNGVITWSGTLTTSFTTVVVGSTHLRSGETYKLTGGIDTNAQLSLRYSNGDMYQDNTDSKQVVSPKPSYGVDTFTANQDADVNIVLRIARASTVSDEIKPMLCLKSDYDLDPTYVPPAKTNLQLTTDKVGWDDYSQLGSVNLLDITGTTSVSHGITFTVNDGTINVTGDGDAGGTNPYLVANPGFTLPKGTYKLSGCPSGQSLQTAWLFLRTLSGEQIGNETGNGLVFTVTDETVVYQLRVYAYNRASDLNLTFYPMIAPVSYNGPYVPPAKTNKELTDESKLITLPATKNDSIVDSFVIRVRKQHNAVYVNGYLSITVAANRNDLLFTISELNFFDADDKFYIQMMSSNDDIAFAEVNSNGAVKVGNNAGMPTGFYMVDSVLLMK